jgi:hypothetical protein
MPIHGILDGRPVPYHAHILHYSRLQNHNAGLVVATDGTDRSFAGVREECDGCISEHPDPVTVPNRHPRRSRMHVVMVMVGTHRPRCLVGGLGACDRTKSLGDLDAIGADF